MNIQECLFPHEPYHTWKVKKPVNRSFNGNDPEDWNYPHEVHWHTWEAISQTDLGRWLLQQVNMVIDHQTEPTK